MIFNLIRKAIWRLMQGVMFICKLSYGYGIINYLFYTCWVLKHYQFTQSNKTRERVAFELVGLVVQLTL